MTSGVRKSLGAAVAALCLAQAPAAAAQVVLQEAAPGAAAPGGQALPADPNALLVEELVVVARDRGPAWWTVSNGTSTVYVLGAPWLAPKRTPWDTTTLQRRLQGANALILPFQEVKVKVAGSLGAAFNYLRLRSGRPFEEQVDAATRAKFKAAREKLGQPADRYKTNNALAAGLMIAGDYRERAGLTNADTAKVAKAYAVMAKAPVVSRSYDVGPLLGAVIRTPKPAAQACLDAVLDQIVAGPERTRAAAAAWAEGNTIGALENERTYERCISLVPGAQTFDARTKADQVAAIERALQKPGHAVAVIQLTQLLAQGGVLDQLRAKGYQVRTPGEV